MELTRDDAARRDAADPLRGYWERFVAPGSTTIYFDGNSLGRPPLASAARAERFVREDWGGRLIRGWDEGWMDLPYDLGDWIGGLVLGAAPGQTVLADSTTVCLYKLARAAVDAQQAQDPKRTRIVADRANFPTDRFLAEAIATERGGEVAWIDSDGTDGVTAEMLSTVLDDRTALVLLSHVDYRSAYIADAAELTAMAHEAGALVLWDLCHAAGAVPVRLDEWGVDLAVGCTYKYLNGGPGSPAFCYVRADLADSLSQPIQGWMGAADVFAMGPEYRPGGGIRRFVSGTPPILGMVALPDTLDLIEQAGLDAIRAKSMELTGYAIALSDEWLAPLGASLASPRDPAVRGGHVTVRHPAMRTVSERLRDRDVLPDFRAPDGLRIGLSPLTTSFVEVHDGLQHTRDILDSVVTSGH